MNDLSPDAIAAATHAAMLTLPAYAELARALDATDDDDARLALLANADDSTRRKALEYLASSRNPAMRERQRRLAWMRQDPQRVAWLKHFYRHNIAAFVDQWGQTLDPRLLARGGSAVVPFRLFPKQRDMIDFMLNCYRQNESGVIVKARDCGASWCAMSMLASLCLFNDNFAAIIGSALEIKIDVSGTTGTLMHKARMFLEYLPEEFRGGWNVDKYSAHMRLWFSNGSSIQGQAGLQIGRGERASIVVLDEAAHIEHADKVDESLAATSDVKLYISSVNGPDNSFAVRARNDAVPRFYYRWSDDPRKTPEWREKRIAADGLRKFNQEYDCDFLAGTQGQLIPREHLDACIDAHVKLGLEPTGRRYGAFDIGNGGDPSAFAVVQGFLIEQVVSWPSGTNLLKECRRAFAYADQFDVTELCADAVGVGASVEGDAQQLNSERTEQDKHRLLVTAFKGSESALFPDSPAVPGSKYKTKDTYLNRKSQAYDWLRYRAAETYKAVQGETIRDFENILSISSKIPELNQLLAELGQITAEETMTGKLKIDKYGDGFSPNRADAVSMAAAPRRRPFRISDDLLASVATPVMPGESGLWDTFADDDGSSYSTHVPRGPGSFTL
ncbi:MAG TPA: hypothetical protein VGM84_26280 [Steroidobacteraceae bacterium]|jgi:hypothetical protein